MSASKCFEYFEYIEPQLRCKQKLANECPLSTYASPKLHPWQG